MHIQIDRSILIIYSLNIFLLVSLELVHGRCSWRFHHYLHPFDCGAVDSSDSPNFQNVEMCKPKYYCAHSGIARTRLITFRATSSLIQAWPTACMKVNARHFALTLCHTLKETYLFISPWRLNWWLTLSSFYTTYVAANPDVVLCQHHESCNLFVH